MTAKPLTRRLAPAGPAIDEARTRVYYWWLLLAIFFEYVRPGAFIPVIGCHQVGHHHSRCPACRDALCARAASLGRDLLGPLREVATRIHWLIALSVPFAEVTLYAYNTLTDCPDAIHIVRHDRANCHLTGPIARNIRGADRSARCAGPAQSGVAADARNSLLRQGRSLSWGRERLRPVTVHPDAVGHRNCASFPRKLGMAIALGVSRLHSPGNPGHTVARRVACNGRCAHLPLDATAARRCCHLLAILLVGLFVLIYASDAYFNRMGTIAHYEEDGSAEGRIEAWKASLRMAIDHPLTGVGAGQFPSDVWQALP